MLLLILNGQVAFSQANEFQAVLLSRESDYHYRYKAKTRAEILIQYHEQKVYYRKKATRKFKQVDLPVNLFFKDSIDYGRLQTILVNGTSSETASCNFRNKGSIKIELIYGTSHQNFTRTYEFGSVLSCDLEEDYKLFRRIEEEYLKLDKQIFK